MTAGAGTGQPTRTHRPGRIIERPRLIKQLDAAEAPVILIVAPAGYGKTTLARQWTRGLNGVIWVSCTPSHRDVVTFAEDIASGIDALGGNASRFVGEYVRARSNPQRAAREIAQVLVRKLNESSAHWLVIDDYQELTGSAVAEEVIRILRGEAEARLLIASRVRPVWATPRETVYGAVADIRATDLALTDAEAEAVVGRRPDLQPLIEQAHGWPAVVTLAGALSATEGRPEIPGLLHDYVGDELFKTAPPRLQRQLIGLSLLPDLTPATLQMQFGAETDRIIEQARDIGFIGADGDIHPLLREFLLSKLAEDPDGEPRVRSAVEIALTRSAWEQALDLVLRFHLSDLTETVFGAAFKPLNRAGRLATLSGFADRIRQSPVFAPPAVDVIDADVALRDGQFELAAELARRAANRLPDSHGLTAKAHLIRGRATFFAGDFTASDEAYERALATSLDEPDETESLFGQATTRMFAEIGDPMPAMKRLADRRALSPVHLVRHATAELSLRRFERGLRDPLPIDEAMHCLVQVEDPHIRSAFTYTAAHAFAQRAEYRRAERTLERFQRDVRDYGLEFAQPFADWTSALISLGLRRFGEADRHLTRVESVAGDGPASAHTLNARFLRARLLLQIGDAQGARDLLETPHSSRTFPSWTGELHAMRAFSSACLGDEERGRAESSKALAQTRCLEVCVLAELSIAIIEAQADGRVPLRLFALAEQTGVWDPLLAGLRASPRFLEATAADPDLRPALEQLIRASEDVALARQARIRSKPVRTPAEVLSPRELEVLGLVAQGLRNRDIAKALFVAESTVKVHVRHILEKLGVRTRAHAVAQFERQSRSY